MGQAIIIKNIDFSSFNMGTVHRQGQPIPVESISILGDSIVTNTATYNVSYIPSNTTQLGVTWSIVSGSTYASIDSQTGELTVLEGASSNNVKIRATSLFDPNVYDELDIVVSYIVRDCSMEIKFTNNDTKLYDYDNNLEIEPDTIRYLTSDETGTAFNRQAGMGAVYTLPNKDIKTISFEYFYDTTKSGSMNNSWGGLFGLLLDVHDLGNNNQCIIIMNKYPDDGSRFEALTNADIGARLDTATNAERGKWHKVCLNTDLDYTKFGDGTKSYNEDIYVDGLKLGTLHGVYSRFNNQVDLKLVLGNSWRLYINGSQSTDANPMCGKMKNIRMFRRTLTDAEAIAESTLN